MKTIRHLLHHHWLAQRSFHLLFLSLLVIHLIWRLCQGFEDFDGTVRWDFFIHREHLCMILLGTGSIAQLHRADSIHSPNTFWQARPPSRWHQASSKLLFTIGLYFILPMLAELLIWRKLEFGTWIPQIALQWSAFQLCWILGATVLGMVTASWQKFLLWLGIGLCVGNLAYFAFSPVAENKANFAVLDVYQRYLIPKVYCMVIVATVLCAWSSVVIWLRSMLVTRILLLLACGIIGATQAIFPIGRALEFIDGPVQPFQGNIRIAKAYQSGSGATGGRINMVQVTFEGLCQSVPGGPTWLDILTTKEAGPPRRNYNHFGIGEGGFRATCDFYPEFLAQTKTIPLTIETGSDRAVFGASLHIKPGVQWTNGPVRIEIRGITHVPGDIRIEVYTRSPYSYSTRGSEILPAPVLIHQPTKNRWQLYVWSTEEHAQPGRFLWETKTIYSIEGEGLYKNHATPEQIAKRTHVLKDNPWL